MGHAAPGTCVHEAGARRPPVFTRPFFPKAKVADALTGTLTAFGSESAAHGGGRGATASPAIYADDFKYVHFNADFFFLKKEGPVEVFIFLIGVKKSGVEHRITTVYHIPSKASLCKTGDRPP